MRYTFIFSYSISASLSFPPLPSLLPSLHCTMYIVQYIVHYTLYNVHRTLYSIQYTMYSALQKSNTNLHLITLLLYYGADIFHQNKQGHSALSLALESKNLSIIRLYLSPSLSLSPLSLSLSVCLYLSLGLYFSISLNFSVVQSLPSDCQVACNRTSTFTLHSRENTNILLP